MAKSRIVLAIEALEGAVSRSQIASQTNIDTPDGTTIDTSSAEIISGNGPRLVFITNLGIQDAFLAIGTDAIAEKGIALPQNDSKLVPLGDGISLHAVTQMATTKLAWQSFG